MPFGSHSVLCEIVDRLISENLPIHSPEVKTVLDLGIGNGVNGCMIKNYKRPWIVDGVEYFENYKNPMWNVYRNVEINDILKIDFDNYEKYDYVIMTDVIEHFHLEDALILMNNLKKLVKKGGSLFISTPAIFIEQGVFEGNEKETHLCLILKEHYLDRGFSLMKDGSKDSFGHLMLLGVWKNI
tara:strand:- start:18274 stop:18825 length:552 start_codon:yes stop_codon:yes gene_type:complete